MFQILVVEDDLSTARFMTTVLTHADYEVTVAYSAAEAFEALDKKQIDLIVLDVMMPEMDGYEFTESMRKGGDETPILMVTARSLPEDKIKGFLAGTDDYMVKPVNEEEMLLRIKALLRRSEKISEQKLTVGQVTIDAHTFTVTNGTISVHLPKKEFYLLYKLFSYPDRIFTRLQIMDEIWGIDTNTTVKTVDVHVNRLRKKFNDWQEFKIVSLRGVGYKVVVNS